MSVRRQVKLGNLDIDKMADIARRNGHRVQYDTTVALYRTVEQCDLVIDGEVGFKRQSDGTVDSIYDDGAAGDLYADLVADYIEEYTEEFGNYHVTSRVENREWITLEVRR
jgi:hypothetical protein